MKRAMLLKMGLMSLFMAASAQADMMSISTVSEYQLELRGYYSYQDLPSDVVDIDSDTFGLEASYYYSPVRLDTQPYAEAAFLQGVGSVDLSVQRQTSRLRQVDCDGCSETETTFDVVHLTSRNYVADYLYIEGTYLYSNYETQSSYSNHDNSSDYWLASIGFMPVEGLLITTDFDKDNALLENGWNVGAKYVQPLMGDMAVNVEVDYWNPDEGKDGWELGGDFYFTQAFSIGGSYDTQSELYTARSRWYFGKYFSLDAEYQELYLGDQYSVGISTRF